MDNIRRAALVAQLHARLDAPFEDDHSKTLEERNLKPTKAEQLIAMFTDQIRRYGGVLGGRVQQTARVVTAQRPFYERYRYKPHNGTQEMARRRKRIALPDTLFTGAGNRRYHLNSHGEVCPFPGVNRRDKSTVS